jgi:hypothetical protein
MRPMAVAALGLAVIGVGAGLYSLALFTSQAQVDNNTFDSGTVIITTDHPSTAIVSLSNMAPGDAVTAPLLVNNAGSLALRYAVSSVATNLDTKGLKDQTGLTIKSGVTNCTNAGYAGSGTVLYSGDLDAASGKLVGDSTTGADGGDRALAAGASETLCFNVTLPLSTGNAFQGAATTATFTFDAEQTKNN